MRSTMLNMTTQLTLVKSEIAMLRRKIKDVEAAIKALVQQYCERIGTVDYAIDEDVKSDIAALRRNVTELAASVRVLGERHSRKRT